MRMKNAAIRQVHAEEMISMIQQLPGYAFQSSPPLAERDHWIGILEERVGTVYYALFEGEKPAACVAWTPMKQHVRAEVLSMGGIFDVVTHPAARRKGYATELMIKAFTVMREEGYPVTSLYPFRESWYENLGYASFSQPSWASLKPANLGRLLKTNLEGEVELALLSECFDTYHDFLMRFQQCQPGMGLFASRPVNPGKQHDFWIALARVEGQVRGAMMYSLRGERPMHFDMRVLRFYYLDNRARYLLLDWIARHVDQARSVEILLPPAEQPEKWLADIEVSVHRESFRGMGRVLDIPRLGGLKVGTGTFTIAVTDPYCPWNEGIWRFQGVDGRLQVSRAEEAECTLKIQGLSALVYGTHDPQDFIFRAWGNPATALQQRMRSLFPLEEPYLHEFY